MEPGWIAFIVLVSVLLIGGLGFFTSSIWYPRVESGGNIFVIMGKTLANLVLNIVPISLFGFGIVADIIKTEVRASIPTLAAFFSLILLRIGFLTQSATFPLFASSQAETNTATYWCSLPGLEFLENPVFPGSVLSTTIIAFYYIWWAINTPNQLVVVSYMMFAYAASLVQFTFGNCSSLYYPLFSLFGPGSSVLLQTTLLGLVISGFVYGLVYGVSRTSDPLAGLRIPAFPGTPVTPTISGNASCPVGTYDDGSGNCIPPTPNTTCPVGQKFFEADSIGPAGCRCPNGSLPINGGCPYNSSNQSGVPQQGEQTFVAELYKNGQLVTDSLSK
jgi:hypothetical protein